MATTENILKDKSIVKNQKLYCQKKNCYISLTEVKTCYYIRKLTVYSFNISGLMMTTCQLPRSPPLRLETRTVVTMKTAEPLTLHWVGAPTKQVAHCTRPALVTFILS